MCLLNSVPVTNTLDLFLDYKRIRIYFCYQYIYTSKPKANSKFTDF